MPERRYKEQKTIFQVCAEIAEIYYLDPGQLLGAVLSTLHQARENGGRIVRRSDSMLDVKAAEIAGRFIE